MTVSSLPPCGGGLGRGVHTGSPDAATPLPAPPPQGGRERKTIAIVSERRIAAHHRFNFQTAKIQFGLRHSVIPHTALHLPRRHAPGLCVHFPPERAWGMPGARCTRSPLCNKKAQGWKPQVHRKSPGIPARNGFNGFLRALPGERACLPPSPRGSRRVSPLGLTSPSAKLDASVGASGPHDFAVRRMRPRQKRSLRPPHPAPRP